MRSSGPCSDRRATRSQDGSHRADRRRRSLTWIGQIDEMTPSLAPGTSPRSFARSELADRRVRLRVVLLGRASRRCRRRGPASCVKAPGAGCGGWQSHESRSVGSAVVAASLQSRGVASLKMHAYSRSTSEPLVLGIVESVIHSRPLIGSVPSGVARGRRPGTRRRARPRSSAAGTTRPCAGRCPCSRSSAGPCRG